MPVLFTILVVVLLVAVAIGLVLQHRLYQRLRSEHPPALQILAESSAGIMAFQRYLWKRHYLGLADARFTQRADSVRRYWTACFLYFLLAVLTLIVASAFGT
jgi:hypothetical protein